MHLGGTLTLIELGFIDQQFDEIACVGRNSTTHRTWVHEQFDEIADEIVGMIMHRWVKKQWEAGGCL